MTFGPLSRTLSKLMSPIHSQSKHPSTYTSHTIRNKESYLLHLYPSLSFYKTFNSKFSSRWNFAYCWYFTDVIIFINNNCKFDIRPTILARSKLARFKNVISSMIFSFSSYYCQKNIDQGKIDSRPIQLAWLIAVATDLLLRIIIVIASIAATSKVW